MSEHPTANTADNSENNTAPLSDLVGRLDALVQCYSNGDSAEKRDSDAQNNIPVATSLVDDEVDDDPAQAAVTTTVPCPAIGEPIGKPVPRRKLPDELKSAEILVIDDEEATISTVESYLRKEGYENLVSTTDSREAMELLRRCNPDVVLLDIRMPEVSGLDILRAKRLDTSLEHIPVIVLTATTDPKTKRCALDLGAMDFLTKPLDPNDLAPRVRNALMFKKHFDQKADEAARLEKLVQRRTAEVVQSRQQLILGLARAAEHRDTETGNHVIRVGKFAGAIARKLGWPDSKVEMIEQAAPLHDVGKIGVPDSILLKPGKLDPQEFAVIENHCIWGKQIIEPYSGRELQVIQSHARLGENILHVRSSAMLMMASRIAQTHHECWDGSGYPLGLAGEDIPLEGRITSIADVFDAVSSKRPYKEPFSREKCFEILEGHRGTKFDPRALDAFFACSSEIIAIQLELVDPCAAHETAS